uniref:Enoyl reductase (ER) domain-containing protein n=1 Tax=Chromera velia CCMP2878 TaxID=1169474 RepID=A0A0G4HZJ6_9ALVE|eukprot:Cvel_1582.t1-p1 / transcript=Cvel_1582.t1 / gene=Cvel_1582 / organism=Chromera_velia_CCMP2878 / gene_product=Reticulon-4-interacting protein 1, mitochondrial, putative / transcript_product=Reticulon-4-interacting protein 1, mitochondrial, putative / location=Cvel_scaffold56:100828-102194(-) / protein_length=416 / sequence_SO=supercontig / SO=protein_coding / is_pseudo=false
MRAAVYSRLHEGGISLTTKEAPTEAKPGHVLCAVECAGVNPVDAKGMVGDKVPAFLQPFMRRTVDGNIIGYDFAGRVVKVPEGCSEFKEGDEVFGMMPRATGSLCEIVEAPTSQIALKPKNLSFAEAAALPLVGLTVYQCLKVSNNLNEGQRLLVLGGSGGVGHMAVQMGKALGAHVTAVCSGRNSEWVKSLGADVVVDYSEGHEALLRELQSQACAAGAPFDLCLDTVHSVDKEDATVGYESLIREARIMQDVGAGREGPRGDGSGSSAESVRQIGEGPLLGGKYVTIGGPTSDWMRAWVKRNWGWDFFPNGRELFWVRYAQSGGELGEIRSLAEEGKVRPVVALEVPFSEDGVREAFRQLKGRRVRGKIVVRVKRETEEGERESGGILPERSGDVEERGTEKEEVPCVQTAKAS